MRREDDDDDDEEEKEEEEEEEESPLAETGLNYIITSYHIWNCLVQIQQGKSNRSAIFHIQ